SGDPHRPHLGAKVKCRPASPRRRTGTTRVALGCESVIDLRKRNVYVGDMSTRLIDQQAVIDIATMLEERAAEDELTVRVREVICDLADIAGQHDERIRALEVERLRAMFTAEPLAVAP